MAWYDITGTVADWVMAGAAGYAAFLAKNWIKPNLQQQGLSKVVSFLQEDITKLATVRIEYINIEYIIDLIESLKGFINLHPGDKQKRLKEVNEELKKDLSPDRANLKIKNLNDFNNSINELKWYGYSFKQEKIHLVKEFYKLYNENNIIINDILSEIKKLSSSEIMESFMFSDMKNSQEIFSTFHKIISVLKSKEEEQDRIYNKIREIKLKILGETPLVTDFFTLKK
ncbi:hypothetical protein SMZ92_000160 [Cronobacter sakazakii]|nr:hypothetical protein [Cronobacter sakazakii]